jgi:hypothetical protein
MNGNIKHPSLLRQNNNYSNKKFYSAGPSWLKLISSGNARSLPLVPALNYTQVLVANLRFNSEPQAVRNTLAYYRGIEYRNKFFMIEGK